MLHVQHEFHLNIVNFTLNVLQSKFRFRSLQDSQEFKATTTPVNRDMIGRVWKNNRAGLEGRTLEELLEVACQITAYLKC